MASEVTFQHVNSLYSDIGREYLHVKQLDNAKDGKVRCKVYQSQMYTDFSTKLLN